MKKNLIEIIGFIIGSVFGFYIILLITGFLWLYVWGDKTWPFGLERLLYDLDKDFIQLFLSITFGCLGYLIAKKFSRS
jgi:hypothetical protein